MPPEQLPLLDELRAAYAQLMREAAEELTTLGVGSTFCGRYTVLGRPARGGMGEVYRVEDRLLGGRVVAMKVIRFDWMGDRIYEQRFVAEANLTAGLQHANIIPVHDRGALDGPHDSPHRGRLYYVMKLADGERLSDVLRARSGQPVAERRNLLGVFASVCEALGYAHSKGVIHRDMKPENVMVGASDAVQVQVLDWGLAKPVSSGEDDSLAASRRRASADETQAGQVLGTPAYIAPEQARGEPVDARADVFALGGWLAAILTGRAPFGSFPPPEALQKAAAGDLTDVYVRLDGCGADAELVAVAKRCLAANAADRYATGKDVATALSAYHADSEERGGRPRPTGGGGGCTPPWPPWCS